MKNFYKLLLIVLFIFGTTSVQAQDENNPWQVSFGMHAVDQEADTDTKIPEFFDVEDNWNISPPFSMFSVSRYLGDNLSFGIGASMNSISKYATFHQDENKFVEGTVGISKLDLKIIYYEVKYFSEKYVPPISYNCWRKRTILLGCFLNYD